ncbi:STAS domain-containing protein [Microcoleus sp. bin38.metabat.b11b12b14.051]|uniref:STAS domain-containing protein n=1 Tax=Microcoleus sp. bin38.metabat.b11b12b14.051 TaxID=2742709 RepID=UPI0025DBFC6D|nr:STAS domain-containing protein [Microcoleus sp. bin38.metabat.b11b12b14.051]
MQTLLAQKTITVIRALDHLNAATAGEFAQQLTTAISAPGVVAVLVDVGGVTFIDSAGLMALISGLKQGKKMGRRFSICSVSAGIRMILELSQLDRVFEIFESVESYEAANAGSPAVLEAANR